MRGADTGRRRKARWTRHYSSLRGALFEYLDGGQGLALEEFQEGAAGGGDIGDIIADAELGDGRQRVTTARDRESLGLCDRLGQALGTGREVVEFEYAEWTVPDNGAGLFDLRAQRIETPGT